MAADPYLPGAKPHPLSAIGCNMRMRRKFWLSVYGFLQRSSKMLAPTYSINVMQWINTSIAVIIRGFTALEFIKSCFFILSTLLISSSEEVSHQLLQESFIVLKVLGVKSCRQVKRTCALGTIELYHVTTNPPKVRACIPLGFRQLYTQKVSVGCVERDC